MAAASSQAPKTAKPPRAWRLPKPLIIFWGAFAGVAVIGIGVLQYLGPPPAPALPAGIIHHAAIPAAVPVETASLAPVKPGPPPAALPEMGTGSTLAPGQPIAAPIAGLLGPSATNANWLVPQLGPNNLTSMQAYAASAPSRPGPHVSILVAGIGDDDTQSQEAVNTLPAAVSLALSPYGQHSAAIAALARASGHEILLALPMQEANPATENAGNEALVMAGPITQDQPMLDWNLSRFEGYAGVTDAIGLTQGAGFMDNTNAKAWLLQEIADKGLFFIDARPTGPAPYAWNRTADVVIDPVLAPEKEAAQLTELAADAKQQGNAMGILLNPEPAALAGLASWIATLNAQGIALVPVSALVVPPIGASPTGPAAAVAPAAAPAVNP